MVRDYTISGECLVQVKGSSSSLILGSLEELGLAEREVRIVPTYYHRDVFVDDFGPNVPAEVHQMLAVVNIHMTLIQYDPILLETCLAESLGGGTAGLMNGAGQPMGGMLPRFSANNHFIGLNLTSPVLRRPWRFLTAYLEGQPVEIPIGTSASKVVLNWRAIPYFASNSINPTVEIASAGAILFDHELDT